MAHSKTLASYDYTYFEVFQKAVDQPHVITFKDKKAAMRARLALYGFRRALLKEPKADPELAKLAPGIRIYMEGNDDGTYSLTLTEEDPVARSLNEIRPLHT